MHTALHSVAAAAVAAAAAAAAFDVWRYVHKRAAAALLGGARVYESMTRLCARRIRASLQTFAATT